jgi:hypothetical protein
VQNVVGSPFTKDFLNITQEITHTLSPFFPQRDTKKTEDALLKTFVASL